MKIRNGFVSNSSSSSFIISSSDKIPAIKLEIKIDELDYKKVQTEEELKDMFLEDFGLKYSVKNGYSFEQALEDENYAENFNNALNEIKAGKVLWYIDVCSDSGDGIEHALYYKGIPSSKDYDIIYESR